MPNWCAWFLLLICWLRRSSRTVGSFNPESWDPVDCIDGQAEAIRLVLDSQLQRRVDIPLFLVTTNVDVVLAGAAVGKSVNKPRIRMEVEDYRLIRSE